MVPRARRRRKGEYTNSLEAMARVWMALCLLPLARAFVAGPALGLRVAMGSTPGDPRVAIRGGVSGGVESSPLLLIEEGRGLLKWRRTWFNLL